MDSIEISQSIYIYIGVMCNGITGESEGIELASSKEQLARKHRKTNRDNAMTDVGDCQ